MTYQTETSDFIDDVDAAGGFVSTRTLDLLDAFVVTGKADGWWTAIGQLWIPVGDFAASKIALLGPAMTFNNFVAADYKEATGYVLSRNLNKYIQTGFIPNSNSVTSSSMTMAIVASMPRETIGVASAFLVGCDPASGSTDPSPFFDGNYYGHAGIAGAAKRVELPIPADGDIGICRYGSGNRSSFADGVKLWQYTNAVAVTVMTTEVTLFRTTRADDEIYYSPGGIQFWMIGTEISNELCIDLNAAIKTLMEGLRSSFAVDRLVTFGDSIGVGSLATDYTLHDNRFSALVARDLGLTDTNVSQGSRRMSTDITNIPAGITVYDGLLNGDPDFVIVQLGVNDKRSDPLKGTTGTTATITSLTTNLNTILAALIADGKTCVVVGPGYGTAAEGISEACNLAYAAAAESAATTNSVPFVDAYALFVADEDPDNNLMGDSIHWNNAGHRLIADAIVAAFQSSVTQTLEFNAGTGLPIYGKLFATESDAVIATRNAIEKTNDAGRFKLIVFDNSAGAYRLNGFVNLVGGFANETYDLLGVTDTYLPRSESSGGGGGASAEDIAAIKAKTDLITSQTSNQQRTPSNTFAMNRGDVFSGTHAVTTDYTGYTATFTIRHRVTDVVLCTATAAVTSATVLTVTLTTDESAFALLVSEDEFGAHPYDIQLVNGATQKTEFGVAIVRRDVTRS